MRGFVYSSFIHFVTREASRVAYVTQARICTAESLGASITFQPFSKCRIQSSVLSGRAKPGALNQIGFGAQRNILHSFSVHATFEPTTYSLRPKLEDRCMPRPLPQTKHPHALRAFIP